MLDNLILLSQEERPARRNAYAEFEVRTDADMNNCFKMEDRADDSKYKEFPYYGKLRDIIKKHLEYYLEPEDIFISGIMYRIGLELQKNDIDLEFAFSDYNKNRKVNKIIADELDRCKCLKTVRNFRGEVKSFLEVFLSDFPSKQKINKPSSERWREERTKDLLYYEDLEFSEDTLSQIKYSREPDLTASKTPTLPH